MRGAKPAMGCLQHGASKLLEASLAHNTNTTYKTAIVSMDNFRTLYQLPTVWPAPKSHIVLFIAY